MWKPLGYVQQTGLNAVSGLASLAGVVGGATNASPIVISDTSHGLLTGDEIIVEAVAGNTAANGRFSITKIDANSFSLDGSTGNGAYTSGGVWRMIPAGSQAVMLQAEAQSVRWRDDGTDPAAGVGMILLVTQPPFLYYGDLLALKFIEATATAKLNVTYLKMF